MTYLHTYMYVHININIIMVITKLSDNIRSRLREIPLFMHDILILRTTVPNIAKVSDASDPFTLPFLVTFHVSTLLLSIYHNGPN